MQIWVMSGADGKLFHTEDSKWFYEGMDDAIEVFKRSGQEIAWLAPEGEVPNTHVLRRTENGKVVVEELPQS